MSGTRGETRGADAPPRPDASPGLLRRRYSVPETIMRKYRLAQLRSDSDDSEPATAPSRDRSPATRGSAPPRRLWDTSARRAGSNGDLPPCRCAPQPHASRVECEREYRSLDSSRVELRHSFARDSVPSAGWTTPKRQRLASPSTLTGSDEMLRTAVRNSYERREEPSADSTYRSHGHKPLSGEESHLSDSTDRVDDQPRKKRRQSVCIYIDPLDSPSIGIKSEITDTTQETDSQSAPRSEPTASYSTFLASDTSSSQVYTEMSSGVDSVETNDVRSREESPSIKSEQEVTCIANNNNVVNNSKKVTTASKLTESTSEILEIVVSETLNSSALDYKHSSIIENVTIKSPTKVLDIPKHPSSMFQALDLDQYVSNILFESLNSLSDQIEEINASIGLDHKISIVEKEIKVKLQNTGMNTIVHLSPTSNNQIIFGNEELYEKHEIEETQNSFEDKSTSERGTIKIEMTDSHDFRLTDSSDNVTHISAKELENDNELSASMMNNENMNKTVLQQIQKLFHEGLDLNPVLQYPGRMVPEISHIEISNVDVFIDDNSDTNFGFKDQIEINTDRNSSHLDCIDNGLPSLTESALGEVGTGTYFKEPTGPVLVPRFSAFPNTESMEVNTSSSEDADVIGSDCTSLVDSLDDPNSPRNILLRRARRMSRRSDLVRSAIDVLDLLPEMSHSESRSREKSEAFFIRIRDNDCDCEKENVVVADHMPDKIKQRLYRRHRKRELRMEYAKRKKARQIKRDIDQKTLPKTVKSRIEIEKDCNIILQSLLDEVLANIVEEEHKYMRIKNSSDRAKKLCENVSIPKKAGRSRKGDDIGKIESFSVRKNGIVHYSYDNTRIKNSKVNGTHEDYNAPEKVQFQKKQPQYPLISASPGDRGPKRFYQKSEIHDGNKCIEILEIIEYVDSSTLSSSPDTCLDEKDKCKLRKSRIPIPIYDRIHKLPKFKNNQQSYKNYVHSSPNLKYENHSDTNYDVDSLITDIIIDSINHNDAPLPLKCHRAPTRRASVPQQDLYRSRSNNTLRFKQMFDIIPEEKSSLSVESSNEDINFNRRVTVPVLVTKTEPNNNRSSKYEERKTSKDTKTSKLLKSTSTSPPLTQDIKIRNRNLKTVATSPITSPNQEESFKNGNVKQNSGSKKSLSSQGTKEGWVGFYEPHRQLLENEGINRPRRANIH